MRTTTILLDYVIRCITAGEFERRIDRKGNTFWRVRGEQFDELTIGPIVRSAVVYLGKNDSFRIVANVGGINRHSGKRWVRSQTVMAKPVTEWACIVLSGKQTNLVDRSTIEGAVAQLTS